MAVGIIAASFRSYWGRLSSEMSCAKTMFRPRPKYIILIALFELALRAPAGTWRTIVMRPPAVNGKCPVVNGQWLTVNGQ
jgi:hypothetical protein